MKIQLISDDKLLQELCREVLRRFPDRRWDFRRVESPENAGGADLTLWDYRPETNRVPEKFDSEEQLRNIFLVDPRHVVSLTKQLPQAAVMVALKPLNPDLLSAMLTQAAARVDCAGESVQLRHERDEILQLLLHSNLKLQEYDQERTRFLARSVHDFRPPLLAVQGYCELMLDLQLGPLNTRQALVLRRMQQSVKRISRLAAGMLHMSAGTHPRTAPPMAPGDIDACISQAVFEAGPAAEAKQIQIRTKAVPPTGILRFDASQMEQALINLLDNACRFTPKKGWIEVRAKPAFWDRRAPNVLEDPPDGDRRVTANREPNAYRIEVRDSGTGFSADDREHIFEERVSGSRKDDGSRAGLGLAICRRIAASHGGIVFAESNGRGATFVFLLPYSAREANAAPAQELRLHSLAG